jgi:predicted TIM-barrel fold metal-dependent hydrolase
MSDWYESMQRVTVALLALLASISAQAADAAYYGPADFQQVEKIDAHVHLHGSAQRFMAQAIEDNFRLLEINVDYPDFPPIAEQQRDAVSLAERYPGRVAFAATFSSDGFGTPGWVDGALSQLESARQQHAVGIKLWKNFGMSVKDADGHYVMPDDPRLAPIISNLEHDGMVLLGHQAEPHNCWLPLERMTVRSDREYFSEHPQYYMYRHPQMPSHGQILAARDRMLRAHPSLKFDAVHLASLEWDVDRIARFLDRFPNANVDMAARTVHLEYQAVRSPDKVRRFLIRYQDRILYGSDDSYGPGDDDAAALRDVHSGWMADWRFLTGSDKLHSSDFAGAFRGMHLPRNVVDKIYRSNAQTMFSEAWR